jgi:hypothetical protein
MMQQHEIIIVPFVKSEEAIENQIRNRQPESESLQRHHISIWGVWINEDTRKA